jgi:integrin beta 3
VARLRLITLAFVTLVLLGALPGFFVIRGLVQDPAFRAMDTLPVPSWAAQRPVDQAVGNRWCFQACRVRQRTLESQRELAPTLAAYRKALGQEGWKPWQVQGCPARQVRGNYTCWRRDEYTLDLWVRAPDCRKGGGAGDGVSGNACPESIVTVVIRNAGADPRLR